jgi:cysteine-rich repeat protein
MYIGALAGIDPHNGFGPGLAGFHQFNVLPPTADVTTTLTFGNPYSATWPRVADESYTRRRRVRVPGATATQPGNNVFSVITGQRGYAGGPLGVSVQVAPPGNLRVNGNTASDGVRTFDGVAPISVQWSAVTNAVRYRVTARRLTTQTINMPAPPVATIVTTETSVPFPAENFAAGERYVFLVTAIRDSLPYATGRLRDRVTPLYSAQSATGVILLSNTCGNGTREGTEECDTAGATAACDIDCSMPLCGDGLLNTAASEICDPGLPTPTCDTDCSATTCGDGTINRIAGEECDDSNSDNNDGCSAQCRWEDACPDGVLHPLYGEECDDGNTVDTDACPTTCRNAFCQDGFVQTGVEQCDDGNAIADDGCAPTCTTE